MSLMMSYPDELTDPEQSGAEAAVLFATMVFVITREEAAPLFSTPPPVGDVLFQMVGGVRSGMGYCGVSTIRELQTESEFVQITSAGLRESHPHDVVVTREAPNYSI